MTDMSVAQARQHFSDLLDRAATSPVYISRRGKRVVAVVDVMTFERMVEFVEDMEDVKAAEEAREEMRRTGEEPVPWEEVKAELGLS
ncbi:MAG: type II toxin-antitoxin system prevent-host-death family antitoxin [Aeromicrobium sp.]